jgi:tetratricopeptide (TPR) repeat protein
MKVTREKNGGFVYGVIFSEYGFGAARVRVLRKSLIGLCAILPLLILRGPEVTAEDNVDYLARGQNYFNSYWHKENLALEEFIKAAQSNPENAEVLFWLGRAYHHMRNFEKASDVLNDALKLTPKDFRIHAYLAYNYGRLGEESLLKMPYYKVQAIKHVKKTLKLNQKCSHAYNAWAVGFSHLRMWDTAEEYLHQAIKANKNNCWSHNQLGAVYLSRGDLEKAAESFGKAMKIAERELRDGKRNDEIPRGIALYYEEAGHFREGLQYAEIALEWNPGDLQILPEFSIKKLISRLKREVEQGEAIPRNLPDELIVGGID